MNSSTSGLTEQRAAYSGVLVAQKTPGNSRLRKARQGSRNPVMLLRHAALRKSVITQDARCRRFADNNSTSPATMIAPATGNAAWASMNCAEFMGSGLAGP